MSGFFTRRTFLKLAGLGATSAFVAACQPKVVEVTREVEKVVQQTVVVEKVKDQVLLRWNHRLGTEWKMYASAITAFKEMRPDVLVNEEVVPATGFEYGPKLVSMIAGGVAGDMVWMANGSGSFQFLASNKTLTPLDEMVNADSNFTLDGYFPRAVEMLRIDEQGVGTGPLYALPELAQAYPVFLFFNQTLFEQESVPPPTDDLTRDDLLILAQKMTKGDRFGFAPSWNNLLLMRHHTLPYGLEPISDDGKTALVDTPEVKDALRWLFNLYLDSKVAPMAADVAGDVNQMFLGQKLVMSQLPIPSYFTYLTMVKDQFKWDMVLMPKGPADSRGQHLSGDGAGINAQSKIKDVVWEFMKVVTDDERQLLLLQEIGLASRPSAFKDPSTADKPYFQRCFQMIDTAARLLSPANFRQQEINTTISAVFTPLQNGERQPDDAFFAEANRQMQEVLDKPRE